MVIQVMKKLPIIMLGDQMCNLMVEEVDRSNHLTSNKAIYLLKNEVFVIIVEKMIIGKGNVHFQEAMLQECYKVKNT